MLFLVSYEERASINIIKRIESPDRTHVATVFNMEGNATVPLNVHIFLGGQYETDLSNGGNIFRGIHSEKATVTWTDNKNLIISTDAEDILLMKRFESVNIEMK